MGDHPAAGIFISYSQDDHYIAQTVIELLKDSGRHLWTTLYSVLDQHEWQTLSWNAVEQCRVCLIVLTPQALTEPRVLYEIAAARETRCAIIPLLFRSCDLPAALADVSPVDFRGDVQQARRELAQRLSAVLGEAIQYPGGVPAGISLPQRKRRYTLIDPGDDGIPSNIKRIANPITAPMLRAPLFPHKPEDIQTLIDAQNDDILPYPEPTPGPGSSRDDEILWTVETDLSTNAVLSRAQEYLERAGYHPAGDLEKQKRGYPAALLYTRGSSLRALLTDSPKQVKTNVAITTHPAPGTSKTGVELRYALTIPTLWTVTVPERLFWIAEIRELGQAVTGEALNRDTSRKRTRDIYRVKAPACCGCYVTAFIIGAFLWLLGAFNSPPGARFDQVALLAAAGVLLVVLFVVHFAAARRWSL